MARTINSAQSRRKNISDRGENDVGHPWNSKNQFNVIKAYILGPSKTSDTEETPFLMGLTLQAWLTAHAQCMHFVLLEYKTLLKENLRIALYVCFSENCPRLPILIYKKSLTWHFSSFLAFGRIICQISSENWNALLEGTLFLPIFTCPTCFCGGWRNGFIYILSLFLSYSSRKLLRLATVIKFL